MATMWRLLWALPLVLIVGFAVMLILRRFMTLTPREYVEPQRLHLRGTVTLSAKTQAYLVEADGKGYLVVESDQPIAVQEIAPTAGTPLHAARFGPPWLRRLYRAGA
jgi:flagellar biogenesis protein FliO